MLKRIIDFILWLFGIKDDEDIEKANILELLLRNIKDIMTGENIM